MTEIRKYNMNCPVCRSKLIKIGEARLETLVEHVFDPNGTPSMKDKLGCSNKNCSTIDVVFWDCYGGLYIDNYSQYKDLVFIDNNNAPFNSIDRKINIEQTHKFVDNQ